jgi:hypothetical protein
LGALPVPALYCFGFTSAGKTAVSLSTSYSRTLKSLKQLLVTLIQLVILLHPRLIIHQVNVADAYESEDTAATQSWMTM